MKKNNVILLLLLISLSLIALVRPNQVQAEKVIVNASNFDDYFKVHINEKPSQGQPYTKKITVDGKEYVEAFLTEDKTFQVGSFYLNQKVSVEDSFELIGQIYLGNKSDLLPAPNGGGDGVGFAFYPGEVGQLGDTGAGLGVQGIKNATGFKLDTCWNTGDWAEYGGRYGQPYGGFITTNNSGTIINDNTSNKYLAITGYPVVCDEAGYIPIKFTYTGGNPNGTLSIVLGNPDGEEVVCEVVDRLENQKGNYWQQGPGKPVLKYTGDKITWTKSVESSEPLALHIAASTGALFNQHSFLFDTFVFEPAKSVTIKDVWKDNGNSEGERPDTDTFTLYRQIEGGEKEEVLEYDAEYKTVDGVSVCNIDKLDKRDGEGKEYTYSVEPKEIPCYQTEDAQDGIIWTFTHTFVGHIALNSVPDFLSWTERPLPQSGELLNRDNDMTVTVKDNRVNKSDWHVSAQVVPTENNEDFSLFSLVWKNPGSTETQGLNGLPVLSNESATIEGSMYSSTWSEDSGVLLKTDGDLAIDDYSGKLQIRWTLNVTPDG